MTTQTFDPLSIEFAAEASASAVGALSHAQRLADSLVAARAQKRETDAALKSRDQEVTLQALTQGGANAETRKAQQLAAAAQDPELKRLRTMLSQVLSEIDEYEFGIDLALKHYHTGIALLGYATAVANLYATGRSLK